ncbi:MAG: hypothetical protein R2712_23240 [Vicinamibacterales bacterium]
MSQPPKIVLADRRRVYSGRIFNVDVDRVVMPTGHTVDMEVVHHPGSVVLIPEPEPDGSS